MSAIRIIEKIKLGKLGERETVTTFEVAGFGNGVDVILGLMFRYKDPGVLQETQDRDRRPESSTVLDLGRQIARLTAEKAETIRGLWDIIVKTNRDCSWCHDHVDAMLRRLGSTEPPRCSRACEAQGGD